MRLKDAVSYLFFAITITATYARVEDKKDIQQSQNGRRISKRDTTVLVDSYPFERLYQKPKMVYRRFSKQRYVQPKPKYGPPKPKYSQKSRRSPPKKYNRKPHLPKRAVPYYKTQPPKSRYGPSKPSPKPNYRPFKNAAMYSTYFSPASSGFGEPPTMYEYRPPKKSHAEPPVDSYGEAIKPVFEEEETYPTVPSFRSTTGYLDNQDFNIRQEYQSWMDFVPVQSADTIYEYSKKVPVATKPDSPIFVTPASADYVDKQKQNFYIPNKMKYFSGASKIVKPWRLAWKPEADEEIIVGGQYAEPPARFVQKLKPSAPVNEDEEEFVPREPFDEVSSATSSPYVNYKNSNMAFSPQNLNDAFSIVDK